MFFTLCASAQQPLDASTPPNYIKTTDILYAVIDGRELGLDLYLPNDVDNPPLLVWVHGGRWLRRTKEDIFTTALVEEGFAIASIDFRLSVDAPFPAQIHDIKAAIRFLRANATTYGYDATRIGIHGRSSGGHLTALVGVTNGSQELEGSVGEHLDQSSDVQAVVSYFGASNLTSILDQSTPFGVTLRSAALALLLGGSLEQKMELAKLASPVFHVDATDPPLLLLHGDQDPQMPINQAHELHGVYKEHGLPVHFEVIHGAVHGSEEFFDQKRNALVTAFLKEHLR
jgi:acetyl esterase/lipase